VNNSVATQFVPTNGSRPCAVLSPISKLEMMAPALFQRTSSLLSCWAKVAAAALTERRSLRSRCRNLTFPGVWGAGDSEIRVWIAFSAFSWRGCQLWKIDVWTQIPWIVMPCRGS
jgi:hypothetical protein